MIESTGGFSIDKLVVTGSPEEFEKISTILRTLAQNLRIENSDGTVSNWDEIHAENLRLIAEFKQGISVSPGEARKTELAILRLEDATRKPLSQITAADVKRLVVTETGSRCRWLRRYPPNKP